MTLSQLCIDMFWPTFKNRSTQEHGGREVGVQFRAEWADTMTWVAPTQSHPLCFLSFSA